LDEFKGKARIIAGGTDLVPKLRDQPTGLECLVDITQVEEMRRITLDGDVVKIGAAVTHHQIISSPLVSERIPILASASSEVGTPQVRNQGTVMGNLINAQPAADTAVALLALGAEVRVVSQRDSKWLPLEDLYEGVGISRVRSDRELAVEVRCPCIQRNQGWAYLRMRGRNDLWLPTLNTGVVITAQRRKLVSGSIAIAPVAPRPFRARGAEEILKGAPLTENTIIAAALKASEEANPRDSLLRGSSEYRKEVVSVLVRDGLRKAIQNLKRD
jgi:carbon-monoxide dehydrogenase medium subunit